MSTSAPIAYYEIVDSKNNTVRLKGKTYKCEDGKFVDLFKIRVLAAVFNRKVATLRNWERVGFLPKARWFRESEKIVTALNTSGRERLYSRAQLDWVHWAVRKSGFDKKNSRAKMDEKVFDIIKERFYTIDDEEE